MVTKINPIGSGKPDISTVDTAIMSLFKEIGKTQTELQTQRSESRGVIIGVLIASLLIVATVAIQVIYSNNVNNRELKNFYESIESQNNQINDSKIEMNSLQNNIDNIKIRNPYLK